MTTTSGSILVLPSLGDIAGAASPSLNTGIGATGYLVDAVSAPTSVWRTKFLDRIGGTVNPNSFSASSPVVIVDATNFDANTNANGGRLEEGPYLKYSMVRIA